MILSPLDSFTTPRERPVRAWRYWAVSGDDLVSPNPPQAVWLAGDNEADSSRCRGALDVHPSRHCQCGIRAMTSLPALESYLALREHASPVAVAEVQLWGHIAGPSYGTGDVPGTVRAQFAAIAGPVQVTP